MAVNPPSTLLSQGSVLGGCRVVRPIGRGGMGEVYLAQHLMLQKHVALKILPPSKLDREHVARFLREARTCSQIEHSNVVTIYNVGEENGHYFIVMQYVKGKNLTEIVETQGGPLPWRTALKIMRLATKGVEAVHDRGLLHRDIKPSNIMVREDAAAGDDSKVLLMDFGLVREETESDLTHSGAILGTPVFMAPEQCRGQQADKRSDIYALGATLYYLLTGKLPFSGNVQSVLLQIAGGKRPPAAHHLNPYVPRTVSQLVERAMSPRREERFADAQSLGKALQRLIRREEPSGVSRSDTSRIAVENTFSEPDSASPNRGSTPRLPVGGTGEIVPELQLIRNIPTETSAETLRKVLPWAAGAAALLLLIVVGLVLNAVFQKAERGEHSSTASNDGHSTQQSTEAKTATARRGNSGKNAAATNVDSTGMVRIPAGYVQMGSRIDDVKRHFDRVIDSEIKALEARGVKVTPEMREMIKERLSRAIGLLDLDPPERKYVPAFWMDRYEVTNAQYARFVQATGRKPPAFWNGNSPPAGTGDHPVTQVTYNDAAAYAQWAGKKLPTLAQWVRAFRGNSDSMFPWGNSVNPAFANAGENPTFQGPSPVTATDRDRSIFGVCNLLGNVREFVRETPLRNGVVHVILKGTDWRTPGSTDGIAPIRVMWEKKRFDAMLAGQAAAGKYLHQAGFRCVYEPTDASQAP